VLLFLDQIGREEEPALPHGIHSRAVDEPPQPAGERQGMANL
jgi:hypothetical protein